MTLYVSDLDGTLLNNNGKLKKRTILMINNLIKKGVLFSFATARSFTSANKIVNDIDFNIPVITMNGVFIVNPKDKTNIISHYLTENAIETVKEFAKTYGEDLLVYAFVDGLERVSHMEKSSPGTKFYLQGRKGDSRMRSCTTTEELFSGNIYYITIIKPKSDKELLDSYFLNKNDLTSNCQKDTYSPSYYWYEIFDQNASKANAVMALKELVNADKVICFGDNLSDISMLKIADVGIAVKNAHKEVKEIADMVISSNESLSVPTYIEANETTIYPYTAKENIVCNPDTERFNAALKSYNRYLGKNIQSDFITDIGMLNEKQVHAVLKQYYGNLYDCETKIGKYCADVVTENGIFEIQTGNFSKLTEKLSCFLSACHVTVVYPFAKIVHNTYIGKETGEVLKEGYERKNNSFADFLLELYRIKEFLTNPNLTICIAMLEINKIIYTDIINGSYKKKRGDTFTKIPVQLLSEIFLQNSNDYRYFLPKGIQKTFTRKDFAKLLKCKDSSIYIEILQYMGIIDYIGKNGGEFLYEIVADK